MTSEKALKIANEYVDLWGDEVERVYFEGGKIIFVFDDFYIGSSTHVRELELDERLKWLTKRGERGKKDHTAWVFEIVEDERDVNLEAAVEQGLIKVEDEPAEASDPQFNLTHTDVIYDTWDTVGNFVNFQHVLAREGGWHKATIINGDAVRVLGIYDDPASDGYIVVEDVDNLNRGGWPGRVFECNEWDRKISLMHFDGQIQGAEWECYFRRSGHARIKVTIFMTPHDWTGIVIELRIESETPDDVEYKMRGAGGMGETDMLNLIPMINMAHALTEALKDFILPYAKKAQEREAEVHRQYQEKLDKIASSKPKEPGKQPYAFNKWVGQRVWHYTYGPGTVKTHNPTKKAIYIAFDLDDMVVRELGTIVAREVLMFY